MSEDRSDPPIYTRAQGNQIRQTGREEAAKAVMRHAEYVMGLPRSEALKLAQVARSGE
jgi:hypothetical protein